VAREEPKKIAGQRRGLDMKPEDEEIWLRHRVIRMRTLLRYAKESHVENGLRELIADAEKKLFSRLENEQRGKELQSN